MGCYSIAGYPPPAPFLHILRHKHRQGRCNVKYWVKQQKFQLFSVVTCGLSTFFFGFIAAAFFIAFIQLLWFGVRKIWTEPQTSICGKQNQKYVSHLDGKHSKGSSAFRVSYKNLAMSESFLFLWPVYFLERGHMGHFALQQFMAWRKHSRCLMHQRSYSKQLCRVLLVEHEKKSNLLQDLSLSVSRILASQLNDIYSLIIYKS